MAAHVSSPSALFLFAMTVGIPACQRTPMRGKVLFCYARRGERPSCRRAAEKHDELAPKDLAVPRASSATPCAMAKTSTLRPGGESKSGLNDDQAPSPRAGIHGDCRHHLRSGNPWRAWPTWRPADRDFVRGDCRLRSRKKRSAGSLGPN
jgi:hypothetical protein